MGEYKRMRMWVLSPNDQELGGVHERCSTYGVALYHVLAMASPFIDQGEAQGYSM